MSAGQIGALRERIALLHPVREADGGGGFSVAYEERAQAWASSEDRGTRLDRLDGAERRLLRRRFDALHLHAELQQAPRPAVPERRGVLGGAPLPSARPVAQRSASRAR